jgi:hypothetical protein
VPFVLADGGTLDVTRFRNPTFADSGLRILGYAGAFAPDWMRYAQVGVALGLGVILARRRRPEAVLLVAMLARVALDSQTLSYYLSTAVMAAVVLDLLNRRRTCPLPVWTWWTVIMLDGSRYLGALGTTTQGWVRFGGCALAALGTVALPDRWVTGTTPGTDPQTRPGEYPAS